MPDVSATMLAVPCSSKRQSVMRIIDIRLHGRSYSGPHHAADDLTVDRTVDLAVQLTMDISLSVNSNSCAVAATMLQARNVFRLIIYSVSGSAQIRKTEK